MRWAGFGPEHDTWEPLANLAGAMEHVEEYEEQQTGIPCAHYISELPATCGSISNSRVVVSVSAAKRQKTGPAPVESTAASLHVFCVIFKWH